MGIPISDVTWEAIESNVSNLVKHSKAKKNVHRHQIKLGWYVYFVGEIPNKVCYDYLAMSGVTLNQHGEMLLSEEEHNNYQFIQKLAGEE